LVIGQKVSNLVHQELRDRDKARLEKKLSLIQAKYEGNKLVYGMREKALEVEKKKLGTWKVRCLDSKKKKAKDKEKQLEA